jgi:uridylate kinase
MMAKNVDGIYDSDPKLNPNAKKYDHINFKDIIKNDIKAMDATAATMCMENDVPVIAFGLNEENSIVRVVCGEKLGTTIDND